MRLLQVLLCGVFATTLGIASTGYAQALNGCKAYITGTVMDLRLVNPVSNNLVTVVEDAMGLVDVGFNNAEIVNPTDFATPGFWNSITGIFDADPACISAIGFMPVDQGVPCPPNNSFDQIPPFEDFGRADTLTVPGTDRLQGQSDINIDGTDFFFVAAAQRSSTNGSSDPEAAQGDLGDAEGNTESDLALRFLLANGEPATQTLELRGEYNGRAEAIVSQGVSSIAMATNKLPFEIERRSDDAVITCDTSEFEIAAVVPKGPGTDSQEVPNNITVICDAANFPDGTSQVFESNEEYNVFINIVASASCLFQEDDDEVNLTGTVESADGTGLCALVLASGDVMFSCNPNGPFSLTDLPREGDGTVKRQVYVDGFFPEVDVLQGSVEETVVMTRAGDCPDYNSFPDPSENPNSAGKRIDISGTVLLQNSQTPVCAIVLANGQFEFTCDGTGSYSGNIPLDNNGQFKLQVYADGFAPMVQKFDESSPNNNVRMARAAECQ